MDRDLPWTRFQLNMARIHGLMELVFTGPLKPTALLKSEGVRADILRTIVVFLHATFEDVLRTTARQRMRVAKSHILNKVPLVGSGPRPEKFFLGELDAHRGKTVDEVIHESVADYLDRESFGSIRAVAEILTHMELDKAPFESLNADLEQLMKKRHKIVHEADLTTPTDNVSTPWTLGDDSNLMVWLLAIPTFYAQLRVSVDPAAEVQRWFLARWTKALERARELRAEMIALHTGPQSVLALEKVGASVNELSGFLRPPTVEEMLAIWRKIKSADDETTEDEARRMLAAAGEGMFSE